jgi:nucleotidyltransferase AbiEii toxin of type IV toxin-antitoxin system
MLSVSDSRKDAARSGARDIGNVEIDVILTYLLQLLFDKGITEHLAFKGGTMLRKMVFGPRGRLSTDLDFTHRTDIHIDDLMLLMLDVLAQPYHGISFRFDKDKDWYLTDDGCAANPACFHDGNPKGVKIKLQVSMVKARSWRSRRPCNSNKTISSSLNLRRPRSPPSPSRKPSPKNSVPPASVAKSVICTTSRKSLPAPQSRPR